LWQTLNVIGDGVLTPEQVKELIRVVKAFFLSSQSRRDDYSSMIADFPRSLQVGLMIFILQRITQTVRLTSLALPRRRSPRRTTFFTRLLRCAFPLLLV